MRRLFIGILFLFTLHLCGQNDSLVERVYYKFNVWEADYNGTILDYSDLTIITITDSALYLSYLTEYESQYMYPYYNKSDPEGTVIKYRKDFKPNDSIWAKFNFFVKYNYVIEKDTFSGTEYIHIINLDSSKVSDSITSDIFIIDNKLYWVEIIQEKCKDKMNVKPRIINVLVCKELNPKKKTRIWGRRKNKD